MNVAENTSPPVLQLIGLKVAIETERGSGNVIDGVDLELHAGETLALVGESGSGKSMTALSIMGLHPQPAAQITAGQVLLRGDDLVGRSPGYMSHVRGKEIAMILQDPLSALNPVMKIGPQVGEGIARHRILPKRRIPERVLELLKSVRIPSAESRVHNYPHHFSGGMRQRVVGAIGVACEPSVLIADEPTTGLDVTVEAEYLALLKRLQRDMGLAILFITHDFGVVSRMADRVAVMYAGRVVELAPTQEILENPRHPYTQALVASVPDVDVSPEARLPSIDGSPPHFMSLPDGCAFAPRCPQVMPHCWTDAPPELEVFGTELTRCWLYDEETTS